jgi:glutathione synthase/RimK-type ligase-like ATP-grasp enzyme
MVLFLTSETNQVVADWMAAECDDRGVPYLRLYMERFPQDIAITIVPSEEGLQGNMQLADREIPIDAITSAWCYLPGDIRLDPELDDVSKQLIRQESHEALQGLYKALSSRRWINPPHAERSAQYRAYQLRMAAHLGLKTPRTLVTNDPGEALRFLSVCKGRMVYKPITYLLLLGDDGAPSHITYTTLITQENIKEYLDSIHLAPCVFQELIPKKHDLTVYVVGNTVWSAAVHSQVEATDEAACVDYRKGGLWNHSYTPFLLPNAIEHMCLQMTRQMGLRLCNFDMVLTQEGEYIFLDANPTDMWAAVEDIVGFPLCTAIVDDLLDVDTLAAHPYRSDRSLQFTPGRYSRLATRGTAL